MCCGALWVALGVIREHLSTPGSEGSDGGKEWE